MAARHTLAELDLVELREGVERAPVGARGGVLDLLGDDKAMVEFTNLPGEMDIDRIVLVPLDKLSIIEHRA